MKQSVIFVLFIVVAVTGLLFGGKYFSHKSPGAPSMAGGPSAQGKLAPDFDLKVLDGPGPSLQLSSLKGKAVLVNLWATWCEPCKVEMPSLVRLQEKYGPQGFQILGVAKDDTDAKTIVDFAHKMRLNYPILQATDQMTDLYPTEGLPLSVYVDRSGKVVYRVVGLVPEAEMEDAIKKALAGGNSTTASAK